ncbi:MAG: MerR family transcriptional regulator [Alphaproteobacteria bacterium]|nr:MerR family transcriptional regulator [Alphaproteobacteria bacterium]
MSGQAALSHDTNDLRQGDGKASSAYRTISEVANYLEVPQHVLRFWESKFQQVRPMKCSGGRRYYRREDVTLLSNIKDLLYNQGFTIRGVQKLLKETGRKGIVRPSAKAAQQATSKVACALPSLTQESATSAMAALIATQASATSLSVTTRHELELLLNDLKAMRETLRAVGV